MTDERVPFWREHLGLAITGIVFLGFLIRLTVVSHTNQTTALTILQHTSPSAALFGLASAIVAPLTMGVLGGGAYAYAYLGLVRDAEFPWLRWAYVVGAAIAIAFAVSAVFGAAGLLLATASLVFESRRRKGPHDATEISPSRSIMVPVILTITGYLVLNDRMWLPAERVLLTDGTVVVGYVLDRDDTLTILRDADRVVVRQRVDHVTGETYCTNQAPDQWWLRSVYQWAKETRYARCAG